VAQGIGDGNMTELHPLVGHRDARDSLIRAHAAGRLPSALLLQGTRGVGKQRLALWLAQLQLCEAPTDAGPCGACRPCRLSLGLEHPDLHWYFPLPRPKGVAGDRLADALESARAEALAEIREQPLRASVADEMRGLYLGLMQSLRRRARSRPTMSGVQVFIIADAELLVPQESSPEAANAILKLLEEPSAATRIVLTSSEPGRLLPTIQSRAVPLHLAPLTQSDVASFLMTHRAVDDDMATWAASLGQGAIGRALGFLPDGEDPGPLESARRDAYVLLEAAMSDGRSPSFVAALAQSSREARKLIDLFAFLEDWLRDLAAVAVGAEDRVISQDARIRLRETVARLSLSADAVTSAYPALEEARELARGNVNPQLIVSRLLTRLRRSLRDSAASTAHA
jgi:DNA polymerase-3 subunit delta'